MLIITKIEIYLPPTVVIVEVSGYMPLTTFIIPSWYPKAKGQQWHGIQCIQWERAYHHPPSPCAHGNVCMLLTDGRQKRTKLCVV